MFFLFLISSILSRIYVLHVAALSLLLCSSCHCYDRKGCFILLRRVRLTFAKQSRLEEEIWAWKCVGYTRSLSYNLVNEFYLIFTFLSVSLSLHFSVSVSLSISISLSLTDLSVYYFSKLISADKQVRFQE
jgi:hypothetical protein